MLHTHFQNPSNVLILELYMRVRVKQGDKQVLSILMKLVQEQDNLLVAFGGNTFSMSTPCLYLPRVCVFILPTPCSLLMLLMNF